MELPWELEEEILSRVPPLSLVRFKTICKRWHNLFNNKRFIKNHLTRSPFHFILWTDSQIHSVCIHNLDEDNPTIEMCKVVLDCPDPNLMLPKKISYHYGFLLCMTERGVAVWSPWLRQTKWLEYGEIDFKSYSIGYNDNNSNGYKVLMYDLDWENSCVRLTIYEFASNTWRVVKVDNAKAEFSDKGMYNIDRSVSLNGTLYFIAKPFGETCNSYVIQSFNFATERVHTLCPLPCKNVYENTRILALFKDDRFSVLEQCNTTNEIVVWVTKEKIINGDEEGIIWINFLTVSIPNFPILNSHAQNPWYFIDKNDDKRLVVCSHDKSGQACIYIAKGDKLKEIKIDHGCEAKLEPWPTFCAYVPNLVPILGHI